jgi:site-specific DNA-methyltransferase (adenine-specific)
MTIKPYYEDGSVTIYLGDCRDVLPHLAPVHLVLTDPPYGIGFAAQPTDYQRLRGMKRRDWDNERFADDTLEIIRAAGNQQIIWGGNYYHLPTSRGWLAWVKPDAPPSMGNVELAWTNVDQNAKYISQSIAATNAERVGHPTQKPLRVMRWCIEMFADARTIIDPFMGSGTTLRAAKDLGRIAIGIEADERYCEMAVKRMAQLVFNFDEGYKRVDKAQSRSRKRKGT